MKKTSAVEVSIQAVSPALTCITTSRSRWLLQVPGRPQVTADPADRGAAEPTIGELSVLLKDQRRAAQAKRMISGGPTARQTTDSSLPAQMSCRSSWRSAA